MGVLKDCSGLYSSNRQPVTCQFAGLILGYIRRCRSEISDCKALFWKDMEYACKTLSLVAKRLFPQKRFYTRLEFQKGRKTMPTDSLMKKDFIKNESQIFE